MKAGYAAAFAFGAMFAPLAHAEKLEDLEAAEAALFEVWEKMPLTVRNVTLITSPSQRFRGYFERESNEYKPGEPIFIYAEPIGYGWKNLSDDTYSINLIADIVVRGSEGEAYDELIFRFPPAVSQGRIKEFSIGLELDVFSGLVGDYTAEIVVHDENSDEFASFELPFSIVE